MDSSILKDTNDIQVHKGISYINGTIISDKDIIYSLGVVTYSKLQYKFPDVFTEFVECHLNENEDCRIPSYYNLFITLEGFELKREIILCMIFPEYKSEVRILLDSTPKPRLPLAQYDECSIMWLIVCFFNLLILIVCSSLLFIKNPQILNIKQNKSFT